MKKIIKSQKTIIFVGIACLIIFSACTINDVGKKLPEKNTKNANEIANLTIKKFSSYDELENFINISSHSQGEVKVAIEGLSAMRAQAPTAMHEAGLEESTAVSGIDYSQTNVQVKGVDEADIVKTDGKFIYTISGRKVIIALAYPAENMRIISEINFSKKEALIEIFVNRNSEKLVIFASSYSDIPPYARTLIKIYNISDKRNPRIDKEFEISGNYFDSRMIGNNVYVIVQQPAYYIKKGVILPEIRTNENTQVIEAENIYYMPMLSYSYNFVTVFGFNLRSDSTVNKTFLLGSQQRIYVSKENIYFVGDKSIDTRNLSKRIVQEAVLPLLSGEAKKEAESVMELEFLSDDEKQGVIMQIFLNHIESLNPEEAAEKMKSYAEKVNEIRKDFEKTVIHKISIKNNTITYVAGGEIRGRLLDQFAMDEHNGYFRIATTSFTSFFGALPIIEPRAQVAMPEIMPRSESSNNVYVLDENLKLVGKLENIAEGEQIYAARFLGDKLFLVTFRRTDPFFVISIENPEKPEILGYLRIPGFSEYLHVYDDEHIMGIGREVNEKTGGFEGIKISLFDISDFNNPKEKSKYVIESRYASSEALFEHKAILFSREKALLVIPVSEIRKPRFWQGVYVFKITPDEISLKGKISHSENESSHSYGFRIRRALYIDNVLYTISQAMIKANNLENLDEIKTIRFLSKKEQYYK